MSAASLAYHAAAAAAAAALFSLGDSAENFDVFIRGGLTTSAAGSMNGGLIMMVGIARLVNV